MMISAKQIAQHQRPALSITILILLYPFISVYAGKNPTPEQLMELTRREQRPEKQLPSHYRTALDLFFAPDSAATNALSQHFTQANAALLLTTGENPHYQELILQQQFLKMRLQQQTGLVDTGNSISYASKERDCPVLRMHAGTCSSSKIHDILPQEMILEFPTCSCNDCASNSCSPLHGDAIDKYAQEKNLPISCLPRWPYTIQALKEQLPEHGTIVVTVQITPVIRQLNYSGDAHTLLKQRFMMSPDYNPRTLPNNALITAYLHLIAARPAGLGLSHISLGSDIMIAIKNHNNPQENEQLIVANPRQLEKMPEKTRLDCFHPESLGITKQHLATFIAYQKLKQPIVSPTATITDTTNPIAIPATPIIDSSGTQQPTNLRTQARRSGNRKKK